MVTDTREYDLFGPWVDEVRSEDDVPRLYRPHGLDLGAARLVLKVPRSIARRDAHAGMDLYDHLVALEPEHLTVLSRPATGGGYDVRRVAYADVVAIEDVVTLLDARVLVHTREGDVVTLTYNGADRANPGRLVEELRLLAVRPPVAREAGDALEPGRAPGMLEPTALGLDDIGVVNAHRAVAASRPELRVVASHGRRVVRPGGDGLEGAARRVAHALRPMTLHAAVVAADEDTVEVFGRIGLARGRSPVHTLSRVLVTRRALDGVEDEAHPAYPDVALVSLVAGLARVVVPVPTGSPAARVLSALVHS
ncbi:hypothetical protein [Nocardioides sp. T2.26MG-1]|uniref:hypothetical protein n=1 Tax=Nocardioides sp. T2.26MG-1 TaxID=3041166 RepID=UPI0024774D11|nr:hypothetical protein [Nocardioides sp. T2.26MG-1]CAI9415167.1 hypothetical protein HIDPHFAB_02454 [Nocardioides sp. T2.26MG-1]